MGTGENGVESKKFLNFRNDRIDQPAGKGDDCMRAESKDSGMDISENGVSASVGWFLPSR